MIQVVPSLSFDADILAVAEGKLVVLHRWPHGMLLILSCDDQMPAFTAKPVEFGRLPEPPKGKDALTTATGYVFHTAEPDVNGLIDFEGKRYSFGDIEDYVTWTDDAGVRQKYDEVIAKARSETP